MKKKLAVFGSTGSIGTQTLAVVEQFPDEFEITALTTGQNIARLEEQIARFKPKLVAVADPARGRELSRRSRQSGLEILWGEESLNQIAAHPDIGTLVMAVVGLAGLQPTLTAVRAGKTVCLATKEVLVAAGEIVMAAAAAAGGTILPVDSEHSAIAQCLRGESPTTVERVILTASGGPFWGWSRAQMAAVTPEMAVRHPNWRMGSKNSIDSATLVNKGLEVIEAKWLFNLRYDQIAVVIHPQSIIHSLVELVDGSVIAQLGCPDMRLPIQYALAYPERKPNRLRRLSLTEIGQMTFAEPDNEAFPGLQLAYRAGAAGGTMPAVFNGANAAAVQLFQAGRLSFPGITQAILETIEKHNVVHNPALETILAADRWARLEVVAGLDRR